MTLVYCMNKLRWNFNQNKKLSLRENASENQSAKWWLFCPGGISFNCSIMSPNCESPACIVSWWRHQMENFFALMAICAENSSVPGEFPAQRPVSQSFDVSFDLRQNKRLNKQSWSWWSGRPSSSLWRHRNDYHTHGPKFGSSVNSHKYVSSSFMTKHKGTTVSYNGAW